MTKHERSVRVGIKLQIHFEICEIDMNFVGQNNIVFENLKDKCNVCVTREK